MQAAEEKFGIPIDEVKITIKDGNNRSSAVVKRYTDKYLYESGETQLTGCTIHHSSTNRWWAWVGEKIESGAYTDSRVRGLRIRVRNIQIDGTEIVREIFREHAKSHIRFQDYFLGEIFVAPSTLVPNARRDGFEEDAEWKKTRSELAEVIKKLGKEAYRISTAGQLSIEAQKKNLKAAKAEIRLLSRAEFSDQDRTIKLSSNITKYQKRIAKASLNADMPTAAELQAIGAELSDIKRTALEHIGAGTAAIDREQVQQEARDEFLREIMAILEEGLSPVCFAEVRAIIQEQLGGKEL